jgi:amino acid adenylation domain-containing protein
MKDLQTLTQTGELSPAKSRLLERALAGAPRSSQPSRIPTRRQDAPAPLSLGQEQIWFFSQLSPELGIYNEGATIRRRGPLDVEALRLALDEFVRRHEIWRTCFPLTDGGPVQVVLPPPHHELPLTDLSGLPREEREAEAVRLATEDARAPYDLAHGPLVRPRLVRLAEDDHRLFLGLHHIVFDGVSLYRIMLPELVALYEAFAAGRPSPLAEPELQFGDYAAWQREASEEATLRALEYWRHQLAGELPAGQLPLDHERPPAQGFRGEIEHLEVGRDLVQRLRELAVEQEVSLFMVLSAAFTTLLHRYSGADDVIYGTPVDVRNRPELQSMLGFCLNVAVVRTEVRGDPGFRELLRRVRDVTLSALTHEVPFDRLVRELRPERDLSANPLFQVMFGLEPPSPQVDSDWGVHQMDVGVGTAKFDLNLEQDERPEGHVSCRFVYNADLFDRETVRRLAGHWLNLLEAIATDPGRRLSELPMLGDTESRRLLVEWNSTEAEIPEISLDGLVERQVAERPDETAVEFEGSALTYRELDERANRLAHRLRELGAERDRPVAICVERGLDMVVAVLATLKSGAPYLPLDPTHPAERLALMVEDSGASVVVTQSWLLGRLPRRAGSTATLCVDQEADRLAGLPASRPQGGAAPGDVAYLIYTSGSTGRPKGVLVPHRGAVNTVLAMAEALDFGPPDALLAVTTLSFDISVLELFMPLALGGRVVIGGPRSASDPQELSSLLSRSAATLLQATPSTWRMLVQSGWEGAPGLTALSGGEPLPRDLADQVLDRCGAVWNGYGPTETTIYSTLARVERGDRVTIGFPISNTRLHVVDRHGNRLPVGVPGELWIGGAGVTRGYHGRPELTADRFVSDPFSSVAGERLYRTGDLVRMLEGGEVEHLGRIDQQVKVRGYRIEPGEIEALLLEHPAVREAVVVSHELSPGDVRLAAYLVAVGAPAPETEELRDRLRSRLPEYMVPSAFLILQGLPRTTSGKLDRKALPEPQAAYASRPVEHARSELEAALTEIWAGVLGLTEVSREDDFFALGGHSLLAVRLVNEVERRFERSLPLSAIFQQGSTVAGQARLLEESTAAAAQVSPLVVPVRSTGSREPLYVVQPDQSGLLALRHLLNRLDGEQPVTAIVPRTEDGRFDPERGIDTMATEMLAALRATQPHGPYRLAGFCLGGLIAYEIARRLREQGEEVAFLGLLDTMTPDISLALADAAETASGRLRERLMTDRRRWPQALLTRLRSLVGARHPMAETAAVDIGGAASVIREHRFEACDAPLTVIASRWYGRWAGDPSLGWRRRHAGLIAVEAVPGDHNSVLLKPHVARLSAALKRALEDARPETEPEVWSLPAAAPPEGALLKIGSAGGYGDGICRVSVVIPARNEAANLPHVLPRVPRWVDELILVDGNSTDATVEVARRLWPGLKTVRQHGKGKGDALCQGFEAATGDIVIALDADGSTDPAEIPIYVGALQGGADFVRGSRYIQGGGSADLSLFRSLGNMALTLVVRLLYRNRFSDLCYGYTAFWRRLLPVLEPEAPGFEIEAQLNARALARGLRVFEVPSFERLRISGSSNLRAIPDGWRVLKTILAERLAHQTPARPAEPSLEVWGPALPIQCEQPQLPAEPRAPVDKEEGC